VVGLAHNWYAIPAADVPAAEAAYFIAFGSYFLFLLVPSLRLPGIYTLTITLVVLGLGLRSPRTRAARSSGGAGSRSRPGPAARAGSCRSSVP